MTDVDPGQFARLRTQMVEQIAAYVTLLSDQIGKSALDERVMESMATVPRHEFVPTELRSMAYVDSPVPIGYGKTISQPFMVALMTDLLDVQPTDRVLEIGTGLGYQSAILSCLADTVYTVEIVQELASDARERLRNFGLDNVIYRIGDGSVGWLEHAPFDKLLVAAAPELIPPALLSQLKPGGRMVIPAGIEDAQQLMLVEKDVDGRLRTGEIMPVRFSPLEVLH